MAEAEQPLKVFLSYSRRDLDFVEQLAADLKKTGLDVWYDLSGLDGGAPWRKAIEKAIRASDVVVVVLSPDSVNSQWVEREYLFASNHGKKVIPVLYKQCELPLYYLNVHYIDFQGNKYKRNFDALLENLQGGLERQGEIEAIPASQTAKPRNQKMFVGVGGLIGLLIVGVLVFPYLSGQLSPEPVNTPAPSSTLTFTVPVDTITPSPTDKPPTPTETFTPTVAPYPVEITDAKGVEMVFIPEGSFQMGSEFGQENEIPPHPMMLDSYYIDKYEVTNILYRACVNAGVCDRPQHYGSYNSGIYYEDPKYMDYPVIYVDWEMADTYCRWRGDGARLPTEAEWEKAARGDTNNSYPWGDTLGCEYASYKNSGALCSVGTSKVGSYEAGKSPYGVYDMAGNVWEWVADFYNKFYYYTAVVNPNPMGPLASDGTNRRIVRGGSWNEPPVSMRSSNRYPVNYALANYETGFRCARPLDQ